MRRRPLFKWIAPLNILSCDIWCPIQYYPSFPTVILVLKAGYLRVTHPFAMVLLPFDLHVLGMPPALILSQDQTLNKKVLSCSTCSVQFSKTYSVFAFVRHSHIALLLYQNIFSLSRKMIINTKLFLHLIYILTKKVSLFYNIFNIILFFYFFVH